MPYCPECGAEVSEDGRFCPECGTDISYVRGEGEETAGGSRHRQSERGNALTNQSQYDYGPGAESPVPGRAGAVAVSEHRLLVATTVVLAFIGLFEGLAQVLFADELIEFLEEEGLEFGGELTADVLMVTGGIGVLIALGVMALTAYYYRQEQLEKLYFWLLIGSGAAGFLLVGSLFLSALVIVGIYGLVVVMD
ncbi:hypothetical protein BRC65_09890 [Halobacteriales archaeon QH_2_65_14]|nr:MAG: hypothetical protein BRC65_09890 [Halobacteriales archaeon QH_2_65_14]